MQSFKRRIIISLSVIAGAFLIFIGLGYFLLHLSLTTTNKIWENRQLAAERTYAEENLSLLKEQSPQALEDDKKIDSILPNRDGILSFPDFLENEAAIQKLDTSFSFQGEGVEPSLGVPGYVPFIVTARGSAQGIQNFASDLESKNTKYLVNIDVVNLNGDGVNYQAEIHGKVYFQADSK